MKKLLATLVIGTMFITSCKKDNDIAPEVGREDNQLSANRALQPIPVTSPTVFFVEDLGNKVFNLCRAENLANANPTIKKTQVNDLNTLGHFADPIFYWNYNTSTNEILSTNGFGMRRLSTNNSQISVTNFPNTPGPKPSSPAVIDPSNARFYYGSTTEVWSSKLDGTDNKIIYDGGFGVSKYIQALAIDFKASKIYTLKENSIFVMNIDGTQEKKLASLPAGESLSGVFISSTFTSTLKLDNNKLYLTTHSDDAQQPQKFKLWSVSTLGTGWKKLLEATDTGGKSFLSFDILPGAGSKIFYALYQHSANFPISVVGKMNPDGTQRKDFFATKNSIPQVIVAMPEL